MAKRSQAEKNLLGAAVGMAANMIAAVGASAIAHGATNTQLYEAYTSDNDKFTELFESWGEQLARVVNGAKSAVASTAASLVSWFVNYPDFSWQTFTAQYCTYINPNAKPEHFPDSGKGNNVQVRGELVHLGELRDYDQIVAHCKIDGDRRRFATPAEWQAYVNVHRDEVNRFPVITFGRVWRDGVGRVVSWLNARESYRKVYVYNCSNQ